MTNIWFTSDTHFGHENIIKYTNRPFKDVHHMDSVLIKNLNNRIKEDDTVFFLGDFCFRNSKGGKEGEGTINKAKYYREQLLGNWIFICGNHDYTNSLNTPITGIAIEHGGKEIWLTHQPENYNPEYAYNFVGHVHANWRFKKYEDGTILVNVGVDVWNFMPVKFDEIMKELNKWERGEKDG